MKTKLDMPQGRITSSQVIEVLSKKITVDKVELKNEEPIKEVPKIDYGNTFEFIQDIVNGKK